MKVVKAIIAVLALASVVAAKHRPADYPYTIELRSEQHRMVKVDCTRNPPGVTDSEAHQPCTEVPLPLNFVVIDAYEIEAHQPVWALPTIVTSGPNAALHSPVMHMPHSVTLGTYHYRLLTGLPAETIELLGSDGQTIALQVWKK